MVRLLAILLSALSMGWLAYVFGPIMLVALPLIVVAIVFAETHGQRQRRNEPPKAENSTAPTKR